jgi:filamentous hemagglutinin family protein
LLATTAITGVIGLALISPANALPQGGNVAAGQAGITVSGSQTTITQATDRGIINWHSFDIAQGEHVRFQQPSASSVTLNRVTGGQGMSQIMGHLSANGTVMLVNPQGVVFGPRSQVNVGNMVASSSDIANDRFMAGDDRFDIPGRPDAAIVNQGTITVADAGLSAFVAPSVVNDGLIQARLGKVQLASGDAFTLDLYGDGLVALEAGPTITSQLASNSGVISASGGKVLLTAAAAQDVVNSLINMDGIISATSIGEVSGEIVIFAEGSNAVAGNDPAKKGQKQGTSTVLLSGVLDASGRNRGEKGGRITVTGDNVALLAGTIIDASGDTGLAGTTAGKAVSAYRDGSAGGDIRIGGDYLGQGDTPAARNLYVDPGVLVLNDAVYTGDAGRTIFWSDGTTRFYGNVYARAMGDKAVDPLTWSATADGNPGDGGFVETSGHEYLDAQGYANLTSSSGSRGTYFLDPTDITIYGNVDPAFQSTDGSIDLATSLKLWLDASDTSRVTLTYSTDGLSSATATGTAGSNTITTSADVSANLAVGARIRLGSAGSVATADMVEADTYTISAISGTTITLSGNLTQNYSSSTLYRGLVSQLADKSGQALNVTQTSGNAMPLWISNSMNGLGTVRFDGSNDYLVNVTGFGSLTAALSAFITTQKDVAWGGQYRKLLGIGSGAGTDFGFAFSEGPAPYGLYALVRTVGGSYVGPSTNSLPSAGQPVLLDSIYNSGVGVNLQVNGQSIGTDNSGSGNISATSPIRLGWMYGGEYFNGYVSESIIYDTALSTKPRNLIEQYQSAKWGIALMPPGTGATEVAKATASDGYSAFTTRYLERLSQTSDISLHATNNITLDFKGDTLALASDRNLTLTAGNSISAASSGTITTTRTGSGGNITITAGGSGTLDVSNLTLNANSGGAISLTSAGEMTLGTMNAGSILARSTGASSDTTIPTGKVLTGSGSNTAITLAAGRNFINNAGSGAFSAPSGRWLVYSTNPVNDTIGGLANDFRRFSCTYGGSCSSFLPTGNGFLYSMTPTLTVTPNSVAAITYGDAAPNLSGYAYTLSGYLGSDSASDSVTGSLNGSTSYTQGSDVGSYAINYASGSLTSALGYGFSYASNSTGITANSKTLTASLTGTVSKTYDGTTDATLSSSNYFLSGIYGADDVGLSTFTVGSYDTKSVGTGKTVFVNGLSLTGSKAGNYTLSSSSVSGAVGTVLAKELTASLTGTVRRTFDGTSVASMTPANYVLGGVVSGDSVALNFPASGNFSSSAVGMGKLVTVTGLALLGADSGNYLLGSTTVSAPVGQIDAAAATIAPMEASRIQFIRPRYEPSPPLRAETTEFPSPDQPAWVMEDGVVPANLSPAADRAMRPGLRRRMPLVSVDPDAQEYFQLPPSL